MKIWIILGIIFGMMINVLNADTPWEPMSSQPVEVATKTSGPDEPSKYRIFITGGPTGGISVSEKAWWNCAFSLTGWPECEMEISP